MRDAAMVMQRALLTSRVPVLPAADVAAAYVAAQECTAAGGDWFDVIVHRGGRVTLVVGDVVGHGVQATTVMAKLSAALSMQLHAGTPVADAMAAVDRFAPQIAGSAGATLCVAAVETASGEVEYCTAGHPAPLVLRGAQASYLTPTGATPLGASVGGFATARARLEIGDVIVLYTDGITKHLSRDAVAGAADFLGLTSRALQAQNSSGPGPSAVQCICLQMAQPPGRGSAVSDDSVVLAAQRRTPPPPLHLRVRADGRAERRIRTALCQWLALLNAESGDHIVLEHAVTEFVDNVAGPADAVTAAGDVEVEAVLTDEGCVHLRITDHRTGKPATDGRGLGLPIAQALLADSSVTRSADGTTVTANYRLTRPADILTEPGTARTAPPPPSTTFQIGTEDGHIIVVGDVDTQAAPTVAAFLAVHSCGGTRPIYVDLSAVTLLSSAAITVLAAARDRARRQHSDCVLIALPGSAAHLILAVAGIPTIDDPCDDTTPTRAPTAQQ